MPHLFDPITVGPLTVKNRIMMPAMAMDYATPDGRITDQVIEHYVERAKGGVGLMVSEHMYVRKDGRFSVKQPGIYSDDLMPGLRNLAGVIEQLGVPFIVHIRPAGARTTLEASVMEPVSPSGIPVSTNAQPRALGSEEILEIADAFVAAARRAREAGFAGVEVHGAHGFLLGQFVSPVTNKRDDEYGGTLENRMRLPLEIVRRVRAELHDGMLLAYRFGADDMVEGGFTVNDAKAVAPWLVEAGVQMLDVSGGLVGSRPAEGGPGFFVPLATAVKEVVDVPVVGVGKITEPDLADSVIAEERADIVAVGRAILKDPDWPKKAAVALDTGEDFQAD
ncbi:MAG: NADH:flavin oxidoreductase [Candidatus Aquicultorales bacterium]